MLVGKVQEPLRHPGRRIVERVLCGVRDPLALDPLVERHDVDVLRAALVGRTGDLARDVLLADEARHRDQLSRLDVCPEDGEVGELPRPLLDLTHGARQPTSCARTESASADSVRAKTLKPGLGENERVRLNAFLARAGVASRRRADELIFAGRVLVNGARGELNTVVGSRDVVEVDGERVAAQPLAYVLLHKPAGVVTTARDPHGRKTVVQLVPHTPRVVPVGRLDADTTGALLLTNDGPLAHRLAHPRYGVEKVYEAEVAGVPDETTLYARCETESSWTTARPRRQMLACSGAAHAPRSSS